MPPFDEAIEQSSKHLISLSTWLFKPFLNNHVATANYLIPPRRIETATVEIFPDRLFYSNSSIWEAIIYEKVRSEMYITLDDFYLFEWFPRSPGLFHTVDGRRARQESQYSIETFENGVVVYNPYGKTSMLNGGVGNVRLKPIKIEDRTYYLMSASSTGACHEGFPVALPADEYEKCISEIIEKGTSVRTLIGKLKFIPDRLISLYDDYQEVPHLYLLVEESRQAKQQKSRSIEEEDLKVSVAVSFMSEFEGDTRVYASYVNFDPSDRKSLRESIEWMEHDYISKRYKGRVITDFDEQRSHFPDAPFSLKKVMELSLNKSEVTNVIQELHINNVDRLFDKVDYVKIQSIRVEEIVEKKNIVNVSGQGNIVNVAEYMANVTNNVNQNVSQATATDEVKNLVKQLTEKVSALSTSIESEVAQQMGDDVEALSKEMTKSKPRPAWYSLTLNGLKEAAEALGEIGKPVIETVLKLMPLLVS